MTHQWRAFMAGVDPRIAAATREAWLNHVAHLMRPMFAKVGFPLPPKIRITMSLTNKSRAIGVCYDPQCSADGSYEILVRLDRFEPVDVAAILAHELAHAAVGVQAGHKGPFGILARAIGLEGKLTATVPGEAFTRAVQPLLREVGPFPHAALNWGGPRTGPKKQGTRMLKVTCPECGLVARMTRKWIEEVGAVLCPAHGTMVVDGELEGDDEEAA